MRDLLDLCRLNLMEENIQESPHPDRDATLKAIDWKRRQIVTRNVSSNHQNAADSPISGAAEIGDESSESVPSRAGR